MEAKLNQTKEVRELLKEVERENYPEDFVEEFYIKNKKITAPICVSAKIRKIGSGRKI